jgi:hypothetical protein
MSDGPSRRGAITTKGLALQLSMDTNQQLHHVTISLVDDERSSETLFLVLCFNRHNDCIASTSMRLSGAGECEVIPQMLHLVGLNFLFTDAAAIVRDLRSLISEARQTSKKAMR